MLLLYLLILILLILRHLLQLLLGHIATSLQPLLPRLDLIGSQRHLLAANAKHTAAGHDHVQTLIVTITHDLVDLADLLTLWVHQ